MEKADEYMITWRISTGNWLKSPSWLKSGGVPSTVDWEERDSSELPVMRIWIYCELVWNKSMSGEKSHRSIAIRTFVVTFNTMLLINVGALGLAAIETLRARWARRRRRALRLTWKAQQVESLVRTLWLLAKKQHNACEGRR
jgi:hypothetical protein